MWRSIWLWIRSWRFVPCFELLSPCSLATHSVTLESLSIKHTGPTSNTSNLHGQLKRSNAMVAAQTAQLMWACTTLGLSPTGIDQPMCGAGHICPAQEYRGQRAWTCPTISRASGWIASRLNSRAHLRDRGAMARVVQPDCIGAVVTCASLRDWQQCSQFLPPCLNGSQRTTRIIPNQISQRFQFFAGSLVNTMRISQPASQPTSHHPPPPLLLCP